MCFIDRAHAVDGWLCAIRFGPEALDRSEVVGVHIAAGGECDCLWAGEPAGKKAHPAMHSRAERHCLDFGFIEHTDLIAAGVGQAVITAAGTPNHDEWQHRAGRPLSAALCQRRQPDAQHLHAIGWRPIE